MRWSTIYDRSNPANGRQMRVAILLVVATAVTLAFIYGILAQGGHSIGRGRTLNEQGNPVVHITLNQWRNGAMEVMPNNQLPTAGLTPGEVAA